MNIEGRLLANRYEIIKNIGNGGMATVYKAKDHVLNRFVAVKILRDEFTTDNEFIKRFNSEAQAVASLTHPNIVSVYDVGNEGDLYYIVMELIQGKTLKEIIVEEGLLSWKWSLNVAMQIASALETAHKNNIVHRDIKPHNIIITEEGVAKVTDFGIAKAVSNSTITAFGTTLGSVHYFSPEHARGGYTDAKSDLYSLGVVMYEMLTGKVPFEADTPVSVALMHMQEKVVEPITVNPSIPVAVNKIVLKAMQKDPNLRYSSATEMLRDMNLALKNPNGNFVDVKVEDDEFSTQKIPTVNPNTTDNKNNKEESFIKKHKVIASLLGAVILFSLTIGITYFALSSTEVKDVQIPSLVSLTQQEAKQKVEELKLVYEELEPEYNAEVEAGKIIRQDPEYRENYTIKENTTIKVVISKGQELTIVPKVVGKEKEEAIAMLEEAKLEAEIIEEKSTTVQQNYVISQEIEAKKEVYAGGTVKIHVSIGTGIEQVSVPYVVGKSEAEATKLLTDNKLKVKQVITTEDSTKDDGIILKQDIEAGTTVDEGTEVTLTKNVLPKLTNGTVKVNVKSLLQGKVEYEDEAKTKVKKVKLEIKVGEDTVYKEDVEPTKTDVSKEISGIGTVQVRVYIDGVLKKTASFKLSDKTLTIE